jgi:hypothetical protein
MMTDSKDLLADYVKNGSDAAFRELFTRHIDLVYSTALRIVEGDAHRAKDVAQVVFLNLARQQSRTFPLLRSSLASLPYVNISCFLPLFAPFRSSVLPFRAPFALEISNLKSVASHRILGFKKKALEYCS